MDRIDRKRKHEKDPVHFARGDPHFDSQTFVPRNFSTSRELDSFPYPPPNWFFLRSCAGSLSLDRPSERKFKDPGLSPDQGAEKAGGGFVDPSNR